MRVPCGPSVEVDCGTAGLCPNMPWVWHSTAQEKTNNKAQERCCELRRGGSSELPSSVRQDAGLSNSKFTDTDADLIFKSVVSKVSGRGAGCMTFPMFEEALTRVAAKKGVDVSKVEDALAQCEGPSRNATQAAARAGGPPPCGAPMGGGRVARRTVAGPGGSFLFDGCRCVSAGWRRAARLASGRRWAGALLRAGALAVASGSSPWARGGGRPGGVALGHAAGGDGRRRRGGRWLVGLHAARGGASGRR